MTRECKLLRYECKEDAIQGDFCIFHDQNYLTHPKNGQTNAENLKGELIKKIEKCISSNEPLVCVGYRLPDFTFKDFGVPVNFLKATFMGVIDFRAAEFTQKANFTEAKFAAKADFTGAKFMEKAFFSGVEFMEEADFTEAEFTEAYFSDANFAKEAYFISS